MADQSGVPVTAPTPERRVGEDEMSVAEARGIAARMVVQGFSRNAGEWDRAGRSLARLTAEVERLRGVVDRAINHGQSAQQYGDYEAWRRSWKVFRDEIALPTPAPEATE